MAEYRSRPCCETLYDARPERPSVATRRARVWRIAADALEVAGWNRAITPFDIPCLLARPIDVQDARDTAAELADIRDRRRHRYGTVTPPHTSVPFDAHLMRCEAIYVLMDSRRQV